MREPVGVVAAVVPWISPLGLACGKLAPGMLAGCTFIVKPSAPETPLDAYILAECADAIGLPAAGVLSVVCGHRPASEHLIRNPGVDKVAFTGSSAAGKRIASILGERMARYTMELGGKSAAIVLDDYSVDEAVASLTGACAASPARSAQPFRGWWCRRRATTSSSMASPRRWPSSPPATPLRPALQLRPAGHGAAGWSGCRATSPRARPKARRWPTAAAGRRDLNRGYYIEPTLFAKVDNRMTIAQEEIFGPVISLIACEDEADAIRIANDTVYGLNGAVLTHDNQHAYDIARRIRAGNVSQGRMRLDFSIAFGGYKQSGVGREGGREGLLPYLEPKTRMLD